MTKSESLKRKNMYKMRHLAPSLTIPTLPPFLLTSHSLHTLKCTFIQSKVKLFDIILPVYERCNLIPDNIEFKGIMREGF